jgi:hypothetical protein
MSLLLHPHHYQERHGVEVEDASLLIWPSAFAATKKHSFITGEPLTSFSSYTLSM